MGIFINLLVSKSVTKKEWDDVYQETLLLVEKLPLAERRRVYVNGVSTICLVHSAEREFENEWAHKKYTGWAATGDYNYGCCAEEYYIPKDLVGENAGDCKASDAIIDALPAYMEADVKNQRLSSCYSLWGAKTQGEPYHIYLLAIACLIEARLKEKAFIYGDITRGQCIEAVKIANEYLENKIEIPDRCDMQRLYNRVSKLDYSQEEKIDILTTFYLGNEGIDVGDFIRSRYTKEEYLAYWKKEFGYYCINMYGFTSALKRYLQEGFELSDLCRIVNYFDSDGKPLYKEFIIAVMNSKLHLKEKDCRDMLEIDQDDSHPYSIYTLMAHFAFAEGKNKKVDRYIPLEEIRKNLTDALSDKCDVNAIIDEYLETEASANEIDLEKDHTQQDVEKLIALDGAKVLNHSMDSQFNILERMDEEYDITEYEDLIDYKKGDEIYPSILESLKKMIVFYQEILQEEEFQTLINEEPLERCRWIVNQNRNILIRDIDWEKIFKDIRNNKQSFERYYPLVRVRASDENIQEIIKAISLNDDAYELCKEMLKDDTE